MKKPLKGIKKDITNNSFLVDSSDFSFLNALYFENNAHTVSPAG